ncbi:MAG: hypothetical protein ACRD1Y_01855, partial [Terriglobales bacterium]
LDELWLEPETCLRAFQALEPDQPIQRPLLDWLRRAGRYEELRERALRKQAALTRQAWEDRGEGDEDIECQVLLQWHVCHPEAWAEREPFLALARQHWRPFLRALIREHYFRQCAHG